MSCAGSRLAPGTSQAGGETIGPCGQAARGMWRIHAGISDDCKLFGETDSFEGEEEPLSALVLFDATGGGSGI